MNLTTIDSIPVSDDIIETLENVIELARTNQISAVAIAMVYRDGSTGQRWSNLHNTSSMIGSLTILIHKLVKRIID